MLPARWPEKRHLVHRRATCTERERSPASPRVLSKRLAPSGILECASDCTMHPAGPKVGCFRRPPRQVSCQLAAGDLGAASAHSAAGPGSSAMAMLRPSLLLRSWPAPSGPGSTPVGPRRGYLYMSNGAVQLRYRNDGSVVVRRESTTAPVCTGGDSALWQLATATVFNGPSNASPLANCFALQSDGNVVF
jgi:hypothetical protein